MSQTPRLRLLRWAGLAAVIVALLGGIGAGFVTGMVSLPRLSSIWPINLTKPAGWLTDRQLSELADDPELCRTALAGANLSVTHVADATDARGCGWKNAVRSRSFGGTGVEVAQLTCGMAAALAMWIEHTLQPAALAFLGTRVTAIDHVGGFACRNMRGNRAFVTFRSQHASANALDIKAFRLADGRVVRVKTDWPGPGAEARFLAAVLAGACQYFRVAIGPAYNAAHHDHFHLDRGPWRTCR